MMYAGGLPLGAARPPPAPPPSSPCRGSAALGDDAVRRHAGRKLARCPPSVTRTHRTPHQ